MKLNIANSQDLNTNINKCQKFTNAVGINKIITVLKYIIQLFILTAINLIIFVIFQSALTRPVMNITLPIVRFRKVMHISS